MIDLNMPAKAKGLCRVQLRDTVTGEIKLDTGDFDNLLLNNFFTLQNIALATCHACTNSTVAVTDTSIASLGSTTVKTYANLPAEFSGTLATVAATSTFTFTAGSIVGNMSCIGLYSGATLVIKTLIKDVNGDPTTISVGAADQLIVTHTLKLTVDQYPASFTANVDGTTHTFQFMASRVDTIINSGAFSVVPFSPFGLSYNPAVTTTTGITVAASATDITPGVINTNIVMTSPIRVGDGYSVSNAEATSGKVKAIVSATMAANTNLPGNAGIGFIGVGQSTSYPDRTYSGFKVTPPLPKDSNIAYTFTVTYTLSR